jgi:hypothetical protein
MSDTPEKNDLNAELPKTKKKKEKIPFAVKAVAKVMVESGFSQAETARELKLPEMTIHRAVNDPNLDRKIIEEVKAVLPSKLYSIAFKLADRLLSRPELIDKMNPYMMALVMGITIDKARLMDGQSTENIAVKGTVAEVQSALSSLSSIKARLTESLDKPSRPVNPEQLP